MDYRRRRDLPNVQVIGPKDTFIRNRYPEVDW